MSNKLPSSVAFIPGGAVLRCPFCENELLESNLEICRICGEPLDDAEGGGESAWESVVWVISVVLLLILVGCSVICVQWTLGILAIPHKPPTSGSSMLIMMPNDVNGLMLAFLRLPVGVGVFVSLLGLAMCRFRIFFGLGLLVLLASFVVAHIYA